MGNHSNIAISYANLGEIKAPAKPAHWTSYWWCKGFLSDVNISCTIFSPLFSDYYPSFCFKYIQSLVTILSLYYENTTEIDFGTRPAALLKELQASKSKSRIWFSQNNKWKLSDDKKTSTRPHPGWSLKLCIKASTTNFQYCHRVTMRITTTQTTINKGRKRMQVHLEGWSSLARSLEHEFVWTKYWVNKTKSAYQITDGYCFACCLTLRLYSTGSCTTVSN